MTPARRTLAPLAIALLAGAAPASAAVTTLAQGAAGTGGLADPSAVAVAPNGDVLVGDETTGRVTRLTAAGAAISSFGGRGSGAGRFVDGPTDIAVETSGTILVADGHRVQAFTASGQPIAASADIGARYVAASADGASVWVTGAPGCAIARLTSSLTAAGGFTASPCPDPSTAAVVRVEADGSLLLAGPHQGLDHRSSTGAPLGTVTTPAAPSPLSLDATIDPASGVAYVLVPASASPASATLLRVAGGAITGRITVPASRVASAPDGSLVALDPPDHRVLRVTSAPTASLVPAAVQPSPVFVSGAQYRLDASGSTPAFDPIARYDWDLDGNGTFETIGGPDPFRTFALPGGTRTLHVRVTDTAGHSDVASLRITVPIDRPHAVLRLPPAVVTNQLVTLDASASTIPLGTITRYQWDRDGNGTYELSTGDVPRTQVRFRLVSDRIVRVKVTGSNGRYAVATARIDVRPAPPLRTAGVRIDRGRRYARSRRVVLDLSWPRLAKTVRISNRPDFARSRSLALRPRIGWVLTRARPGARSAVYVRFTGSPVRAAYDPDPNRTYAATIIVDALRPDLGRVTARRRAGVTTLTLHAHDRGPGLATIRYARAPWARPSVVRYHRRVRVRTHLRVLYVQVADRAGLRSAWRRVVVR